jgi:hypothetical protein
MPLDVGQAFSKEEIDAMFRLAYRKGHKFYAYDEGGYSCWYTEGMDGGWNHGWGFERYLEVIEGEPHAIH